MLHCLNPSGFALKKLSSEKFAERFKKLFTLLDLCVSSLRRGHANLLCIGPILTDGSRRTSRSEATVPAQGVPNVLLTFLYKGTPMHSTTLRRAPASQASRLPGLQPAGLQPPGSRSPAVRSPAPSRKFRHRDSNPGHSGESRVS